MILNVVVHPKAGLTILGTDFYNREVHVPLTPLDALDLAEALRDAACRELRKSPVRDTREPRDEMLGQESVS